MFIFGKVLPRELLKGATIVDVGSRLGVLCYAAFWLTEAARIIGVELNQELCEIQKSVIDKFTFGSRVEVGAYDICVLQSTLDRQVEQI